MLLRASEGSSFAVSYLRKSPRKTHCLCMRGACVGRVSTCDEGGATKRVGRRCVELPFRPSSLILVASGVRCPCLENEPLLRPHLPTDTHPALRGGLRLHAPRGRARLVAGDRRALRGALGQGARPLPAMVFNCGSSPQNDELVERVDEFLGKCAENSSRMCIILVEFVELSSKIRLV